MSNRKPNHDFKLIKVDGYNANKNYIYGFTFPEGKKVTVAIDKKTSTDIVGYLADENDARHAPKGSILSLDNVTEHSDTYYTTKWARSVSKNPQTEDVIVAPTSISGVIKLDNDKTTVLSRIIDPVPLSVTNLSELKQAALDVVKNQQSELNIKGLRGFLIRVGVANSKNVTSGTFKGDFKRTPEKLISDYFNNANGKVDPRMSALLNAANQVKSVEGGFIEVVGFTDIPVFNYGNSKNDEALAAIPNFKVRRGDNKVPTFSFAAITIDRQGNGKITKVTALPGGKPVSNQHALVGTHDPKNKEALPFVLPKQITSITPSLNTGDSKPVYPVTIKNYIHESNRQYDSIVVSIKEDAPSEVLERVLNAVATPPRKGNDGYYFDVKERKKVESALSDVAGTPALYTFTGSVNGVRHTFIGGRTNDPYFKEKLDLATTNSELRLLEGGLYAVTENAAIQVLTPLSDLLKEPATSTLAKKYLAKAPQKPINKSNKAPKKPTYSEWLDNVYYKSAEKIANDIESEIADAAGKAGIDWQNTKNNINWPSLDGPSVSIGQTANVKALNKVDNGSCYVSASFSSWKTRAGNDQYGISITFSNLNKDRKERWNVVSHPYTSEKYQEEVWGANPVVRKKATTEEIAAEQALAEAKANVLLAEKVAKADAQKAQSFNLYSSLPLFSGSHNQLEIKQIQNAAELLNARQYIYKKDPSNKAFAYAVYDIHERYLGYQYVLENKILTDAVKNKWQNKFYNFGLNKDDVRTGLPLGAHHTIGYIDPNKPGNILYSEGYANGISNHLLTGDPAVICLDKDNMKKVIGLMTKKYPNHKHIHVSDNDMYNPANGNVGVIAALDNAYNFNAQVVIPKVEEIDGYVERKFTDTSDLYVYGSQTSLKEQLNNPYDFSDPVTNKMLKLLYASDDALIKTFAEFINVCEKENLTFDDISFLYTDSLGSREKNYKEVIPTYKLPFEPPQSLEALKRLINVHENSINLEKINYEVIAENKNVPSRKELEGDSDPKQHQITTEMPSWPVKIAAIPHPQKSSGMITEIKFLDNSVKEYISVKLEKLGAIYVADVNNNRFLAEHKYLNIINAALCDVTGASRFYIGRAKGEGDSAVIRGDFTNDKNNQIFAPIAKSLGLHYSESALGFVVSNPNKLVFIKEALKEHFDKINPDVEYAYTLELTPEQENIQTTLVKVAHSLGLESKDIAKQHIKLTQHNEDLANLYSPVVSGMYVHAENKVKASQTDLALHPAERVYLSIKTLHTMLAAMDVTNPTLENAYKEDIQAAIEILTKQLGITQDVNAPISNVEVVDTQAENGEVESEEIVDTKTENSALESATETTESEEIVDTKTENSELESATEAIASDKGEYVPSQDEPVTLQQQIAIFQNDDVGPVADEIISELPSEDVESPDTSHKDPVEVRLDNLISFIQIYLTNEYEVDEVVDALREPGSPYYDTTDGYKFDLLHKDIKHLKNYPASQEMEFSRDISTPARLVSEINNHYIQKRLAGLDVFINNILEHNPTMGTVQAADYAKKGIYQGVAHPYMDEDGVYNKHMIKEDLSSIDGLNDITTFTGYFKIKQAEFNAGSDIEFEEKVQETEKSQDLAATALKLFTVRKVTDSAEKTVNLPANKPLKIESPAIELEVQSPKHEAEIIIDNEKSDYDNLYRLAVTCAQDQMTYSEFYDSVFKADGQLYSQNPFVKNGVLQKADVVKSLVPNNFKSPKSFYESAFTDIQGKTSEAVELTRVAGIVPKFVDENVGLASQFSNLDVLTKDTLVSLNQAENVTKQSFRMWAQNEINTVALHPIFGENLSQVSAKFLFEKHGNEAVQLLADAHCINVDRKSNGIDVAQNIISQWKALRELVDIDQATFSDLPSETQLEYADNLNITSQKDIAQSILRRIDEIQTTSKLRLSQYSYIKSALIVEREKGQLPSFVYKQLNNLISHELNYSPIVRSQLIRLEEQKLIQQAEKALNHLKSLPDKERTNGDLENVPTNPDIIGLNRTDYVSINKYKYVVVGGDNKRVKLPSHASYYAAYDNDKILTNVPLSLSDMLAQNIQPLNRPAIIQALDGAKEYFDKIGHITFSTESGLHGVIHRNNTKASLRIIDTKASKTTSYPATSFNNALDKALDFFPLSSIEFNDRFSQSFIENVERNDNRSFNSIDTVYNLLINNIEEDNSSTSVANEIALDLLAKANQLGINVNQNIDDDILKAVDLLDEAREQLLDASYQSIITGDSNASQNLIDLSEHVEILAGTHTEIEPDPQNVDEDMVYLLQELNQSALRDLNIGLSLEPEVATIKEFIAQDNYLPESDIEVPGEAEIIESLIAELDAAGNNVPTESVEVASEEQPIGDQNTTLPNESYALANALTGFDTHISFIDEDAPVTPENIVAYRIGDDIRFGYLTDVDGDKVITRYLSQDLQKTLIDSPESMFIEKNGVNTPIFTMTFDEYHQTIESVANIKHPRISHIMNKLGNVNALSVKDIRLLAEFIGTDSVTVRTALPSELATYIDNYFRVLELANSPSELVTNEDKQFLSDYFGEEHAHKLIKSLTVDMSSSTKKRIAQFIYDEAISESKKLEFDSLLTQHPNNTIDTTPVESVDEIYLVNPIDFKTEIVEPTPIHTIMAKLLNSNNAVQLSAKLLVTKEDRELMQYLPESGVAWDSCVVNGVWDKSGLSEEQLSARIQAFVEPERVVIANKGDRVFYESADGSFKEGVLEETVLEDHQSIFVAIKNGDETDYQDVAISSATFDIESVLNHANSLTQQYFKGLTGAVLTELSNSAYLHDFEQENSVNGFATKLANQQIKEIIDTANNEIKLPIGYELIISKGLYEISAKSSDVAKAQYDQLGAFAEIKDLNRAILVAKRDINGGNHDETKSIRSTNTNSPEEVLPSATESASEVGGTGKVHPRETSRIRKDGAQHNISNDEGARDIGELQQQSNTVGVDKDGSPSPSRTSNISSNGVVYQPNISYQYGDEIAEKLTNHRTAIEVFELNISAIKLAKELTNSGRDATIEEKEALAQYRGWGGLSQILDPSYMVHGQRRAELRELVSVDEYESIKRSTLSSFYTNPFLATAVWKGIERLGIKGGLGIDPAFGIGNFASAIPDSLVGSVTLQAKEIDPLTAEIASHIHGKMVVNQGYEKAKLPSNHFDFAIGNIPFGNYKVYDKNHRDLSKHVIHDYFNLKSLEVVKPGKIVSFITSSGTLDKESDVVRRKILAQADLVGAIRLPTNAFEDNANTSVNTDILFFQKRVPGAEPANTNWLESLPTPIKYNEYSTSTAIVNFNQYFIDNPEMVLGDTHVVSTRYGTSYNTTLKGDLKEALNAAISNLPENIVFEYEPEIKEISTVTEASTEATEGKRLGSYYIDSDGDVAIAKEVFTWNSELEQTVSSQVLEKADLKANQIKPIKALISLRDIAKSHLKLMLTSDSNEKYEASKQELNTQYDSFVAKYGPVNKQNNKRIFSADPESALVLGLEKWNKQEKVATKADIFTERTIYPKTEITKVDNSEDAVLVSLTEKGAIDTAYIESLTGKQWSNIVGELQGKLFLNPASNEWEHASTYLSGHVKEKLKAAKQALSLDEIYQDNVEHLEQVIPAPIPYYEIRVKLGSSWVPANDVRDFIKYIVTGNKETCNIEERTNLFKVAKVKGYWETNVSQYQVSVNSGRTENEFGTDDWSADKLIYAILNNKSIVVYKKDSDGNRYIARDQTAEASAKADLIKETFKQWLWEDPERTKRIENIYNEKVNGFVEPRFDGSRIEIAGLSNMLNGKDFKPREKQYNAIMRYLVDGRALFLHDVGVGKSFSLLGSIMKGKQIGKHSKALLTVPNSVFPQMQQLALSHFPNAKILMMDAKKLDKNSREETIAQVATNNWDIIIMPHSITQRLDVPEDFKAELIEQELSEVSAAIDSLEGSNFNSSRAIKGFQTRLENAKAKAEARMENSDSYDTVNIAEMGIDALFVDEADEFVNLDKVTNMSHVAGVSIRESAKARALYNITQYLHHVNGGEGIVLATGTDIRNNIADQFTLLRYLAPDLLMEQDIDMFDDFIGTFGEIQTQFEVAPEGSGFIEKTRLSKFYNLPELAMIYRQVADIVNAEDAQIKRPNIDVVNIHASQSDEQALYMEVLADRARSVRNGIKDDNLLAISGDGNKAALDMRLVHPSLPDYEGSKVNLCVANVLKEYHENKELNPSQIIFSDIGVPNNDGRFDLYNDIKLKLIAGGIEESKIVFARDFKTDAKKQELQDKMNSGEIAVAIGSTENMGVGKNVQERLAAIHDLSIPWRVRDLEQRGGRIERFGNIFENAKRYQYTTDDSFDIFRWQKLKQKALFAAQTKMSPRDAAREIDEEITLSYSEIMAAATGNPLIQESIELEAEIDRLALLERSFHRAKVNNEFDKAYANGRIDDLKASLKSAQAARDSFDISKLTILGKPLDQADKAIGKINKAINAANKTKKPQTDFQIGEMDGKSLFIKVHGTRKMELVVQDGQNSHTLTKNHYVGAIINDLSNLSDHLNKDIAYYASQARFYEDKVKSLESVKYEKFERADDLINSKLRLTEIQKELADLAEAEAGIQKDDPIQKWDDLMEEFNQKMANDLLKELNDMHKQDKGPELVIS